MLNFGAVDWKADVFVNDILIGSHKGGFTPFSFNITPYLTGKNNQKLVVRVWDPSDKGYQPRGKQTSRPEGIWYTPVTGICMVGTGSCCPCDFCKVYSQY